MNSKPPWRAAWRATRAERLLEAALLEGDRVQRHHRLAQVARSSPRRPRGRAAPGPARARPRSAPGWRRGGVCSASSWISWAIRRRPSSSASITWSTSWRQVVELGREASATSARSARSRRRRRPLARAIRRYSSMPAAHRLGDGGGAVGDAELLVERVQVALDGRRREVDVLADVRRREALGDQPQDLVLALGQLRRAAAALALADLRRRARPGPRAASAVPPRAIVTIASQTSWREDSFER